jgi:hypothetical protein
MRSLWNIGLTSCGFFLALMLPLASAPNRQVDQLIVEKKERYIPAGPGQKPFDVTRHVIRLDEIQGGGPPKNGIPALDHPAFVTALEADQSLKAQDLILGVEFSGVAKAYPVRILNWHEVVNDDAGELPVLISWCPLRGSGLVYDPRANARRYTFGVSGLLYQQNLLFFDHETESLWSQLRGGAVAGPLGGTSLRLLPVNMTTWRSWKAKHPQTLVLSFQTGYKRDYSLDPYRDFPLDRHLAFVISINGETKIYPFSELKKAASALQDDLAGHTFTILFDAKQQSVTVQPSNEEAPPHFCRLSWQCAGFFPQCNHLQGSLKCPHKRLPIRASPRARSNLGGSCDLDQNDIARRSFRRPSRTISSDARPLRQRRQHPDGSQPEPRSTTGSLRPL